MVTAKRKREDEIADLASRVRATITPLYRQLRQQASEGLTASQLSALGTIARQGPITLGDLAAHERVKPPMVTKVVGGLETEGLVERQTDPTDRRVTWVTLTPDGEATLDQVKARRTEWLAELLSTLSAEELESLAGALPVLERLVQHER
jgi:DNA-binding MarR family transcriptional regulator